MKTSVSGRIGLGFRPGWVAGFAVVWLMLLCSNRLAAAELQHLKGQVPAMVAHATSVGRLPGGSSMHLSIGLPWRNQPELTNLLAQIYDPTSTNYHRFLTPAQFTDRFGPTVQDYRSLTDFAKTNGLKVGKIHSNRLLLEVDGSASLIERVFHVTLGLYTNPVEGRVFFAPDREPALELAVPVLSVSGLDNCQVPHALNLKQIKPINPGIPPPTRPQTGSGPNGTYMGNDFRTAYVPGTPLTGQGQQVGLVEFSSGFYQSDISSYETAAGLPNVPVTTVLLDGYDGSPGLENDECSLDIELVIAMAPGLSQVLVYEGSTPDDILNKMATGNLAKQLSSSWVFSFDDTTEEIFQEFAMQGQSFFNASGDQDAYGSGDISDSCSDPNITVVGGTTLTTAADGSWVSETVWNDGDGFGSSGGISTQYPIPAWQQGVATSLNQGSSTMRNIPDVALTADNVEVFHNNGQSDCYGGTSCAAPLWAGFTALVNQQGNSNGNGLVGFLNPALYALGQGGNYTNLFHDIVTGDNTSFEHQENYYAVPGYDLCSGWGTPAGRSLIDALVGPAIPAPPTIICQPQSQTNVSGTAVTFGVMAVGPKPLSYQWMDNGIILDGATNATLVLPDVQMSQAGLYSVLVTNTLGSVFSSNALLTMELTPPCAPVPDGVVSWWPAEGNATDVEGTNNGVLEGGAGFTNGEAGMAFYFDNPNADVRIPASASLDVGQNNNGFTVEAWINCATLSQPSPVFEWNQGDGVTYEGVHLHIMPDGSLYGNVVDTSGDVLVHGFSSSPGLITTNVFYHVALTYDPAAGVETIYLNGGQVAQNYISQITPLTSYDLYLGRRPPTQGETYSLTGTIDEPTLYARALSGDELTAIYQAGSGGKCPPSEPPVINQPPAGEAVPAGGSASFSVSATGTPPLACQWMFDVTNLMVGATNFTLTLTNVQAGAGGGYSAVVANAFGTAASSNALLTVLPQRPVLLTQPASQAANVGAAASFNVSASGSQPLIYQWSFDGTIIAAATNATLVLASVQPAQTGAYSVLVTNAYGSAPSASALLAVYPTNDCLAPPAGLIDWWPGDGNAEDIAGTNNGVLEGGILFTNGEVGTAFYFDNTNADVRIPASASLDVGQNNTGFTVEAWIRCANVTQINPLFEWNKGDGVTWEGVHLQVWSNGSLYGNVVGTNGDVFANDFFSNPGLIQSNVFYHVALTYDPASGLEEMYVNGALKAAASIGQVVPLTSYDLYLGRRPPTQGETYSLAGMLDAPSLYNRALSADKLLAIYQAGSGGKCTPFVAPIIITQPTNRVVITGSNTVFGATAVGTPPLAYQWFYNGTNLLAGATNATFGLTNVQAADAGVYSLLVTNGQGSALSSYALMNVLTPPIIVTQPAGLNVKAGTTATFTVAATGPAPLSYHWYWNGIANPIMGATNVTLTLTGVQLTNAGAYEVRVVNAYGSTMSSNAVLSVLLLDHLAWGTLPATRFVNTPFTATILAQNATNGLVTNFTGRVNLGSTSGLAVTPSVSDAFSQGSWTGSITVAQAATNLTLWASDGLGDTALSPAVNIASLPTVGGLTAGNSLLMYWPSSQPDFILETATDLGASNWAEVETPPLIVGSQFLQSLPLTGTNRFFRLRYIGQ
jgi:hypothetical protein